MLVIFHQRAINLACLQLSDHLVLSKLLAMGHLSPVGRRERVLVQQLNQLLAVTLQDFPLVVLVNLDQHHIIR